MIRQTQTAQIGDHLFVRQFQFRLFLRDRFSRNLPEPFRVNAIGNVMDLPFRDSQFDHAVFIKVGVGRDQIHFFRHRVLKEPQDRLLQV